MNYRGGYRGGFRASCRSGYRSISRRPPLLPGPQPRRYFNGWGRPESHSVWRSYGSNELTSRRGTELPTHPPAVCGRRFVMPREQDCMGSPNEHDGDSDGDRKPMGPSGEGFMGHLDEKEERSPRGGVLDGNFTPPQPSNGNNNRKSSDGKSRKVTFKDNPKITTYDADYLEFYNNEDCTTNFSTTSDDQQQLKTEHSTEPKNQPTQNTHYADAQANEHPMEAHSQHSPEPINECPTESCASPSGPAGFLKRAVRLRAEKQNAETVHEFKLQSQIKVEPKSHDPEENFISHLVIPTIERFQSNNAHYPSMRNPVRRIPSYDEYSMVSDDEFEDSRPTISVISDTNRVFEGFGKGSIDSANSEFTEGIDAERFLDLQAHSRTSSSQNPPECTDEKPMSPINSTDFHNVASNDEHFSDCPNEIHTFSPDKTFFGGNDEISSLFPRKHIHKAVAFHSERPIDVLRQRTAARHNNPSTDSPAVLSPTHSKQLIGSPGKNGTSSCNKESGETFGNTTADAFDKFADFQTENSPLPPAEATSFNKRPLSSHDEIRTYPHTEDFQSSADMGSTGFFGNLRRPFPQNETPTNSYRDDMPPHHQFNKPHHRWFPTKYDNQDAAMYQKTPASFYENILGHHSDSDDVRRTAFRNSRPVEFGPPEYGRNHYDEHGMGRRYWNSNRQPNTDNSVGDHTFHRTAKCRRIDYDQVDSEEQDVWEKVMKHMPPTRFSKNNVPMSQERFYKGNRGQNTLSPEHKTPGSSYNMFHKCTYTPPPDASQSRSQNNEQLLKSCFRQPTEGKKPIFNGFGTTKMRDKLSEAQSNIPDNWKSRSEGPKYREPANKWAPDERWPKIRQTEEHHNFDEERSAKGGWSSQDGSGLTYTTNPFNESTVPKYKDQIMFHDVRRRPFNNPREKDQPFSDWSSGDDDGADNDSGAQKRGLVKESPEDPSSAATVQSRPLLEIVGTFVFMKKGRSSSEHILVLRDPNHEVVFYSADITIPAVVTGQLVRCVGHGVRPALLRAETVRPARMGEEPGVWYHEKSQSQ